MIAFASAKHAPGVTTSVLGLASAWPRPVLIAECDPAGADLTSRLHQPTGLGLVDGLLELRRTSAPPTNLLWDTAARLTAAGSVRLLAGLDDPSQAQAVDAMWPLLATALTALNDENSGPVDVLVDAGRLSDRHAPWPVLAAADLVAVVVRPDLAGIRLASRWIPSLHTRLGDDGRPGGQLRLVVIGDRPYPPAEVADALNIPLLAALPDDATGAAALSAGGRGLGRSRLWRALTSVANTLADERRMLVSSAAGTNGSPDDALTASHVSAGL